MADAKPKGRPSLFTDELGAEIAERLSKGEPLAAICRDDHMPAVRTVNDWREQNEAFSALIATECLEIANTPIEGVTLVTKEDGKTEERRGDMLGHRKLQIETRLKLLAKWDPRRYGDRMTGDFNHTVKAAVVINRDGADL